MSTLLDSQDTLVLGEIELTDSDTEPPKKVPKLPVKFQWPKDLTDSEAEDETVEMHFTPDSLKPALPKPVQSKLFRFAEVFSGTGALSKCMERLGVETLQIDYILGASNHDISHYETAPL